MTTIAIRRSVAARLTDRRRAVLERLAATQLGDPVEYRDDRGRPWLVWDDPRIDVHDVTLLSYALADPKRMDRLTTSGDDWGVEPDARERVAERLSDELGPARRPRSFEQAQDRGGRPDGLVVAQGVPDGWKLPRGEEE